MTQLLQSFQFEDFIKPYNKVAFQLPNLSNRILIKIKQPWKLRMSHKINRERLYYLWVYDIHLLIIKIKEIFIKSEPNIMVSVVTE